MYRIELGNGKVIDNLNMIGGQYMSEEEITEEMFKDMKKVVIETDDGFRREMKRGKAEFLGKVNGTWRFTIRELSKEERKEESRKKKIAEQNEWIRDRYERVTVVLPKGTKERIKETGNSLNAFINDAVKVMLEANE